VSTRNSTRYKVLLQLTYRFVMVCLLTAHACLICSLKLCSKVPTGYSWSVAVTNPLAQHRTHDSLTICA
jgi:hypothetical protein